MKKGVFDLVTVPEKVKNWLIEPSNPSVRYRTLLELLDYKPNDKVVTQTRQEIPNTRIVGKILSQISSDGQWPWVDSYDSPEYGFSYLAELGLDALHPTVAKAAEWFFSIQNPDGSFPSSYARRKNSDTTDRNDQSCYYALTLRGLFKLGFSQDPRFLKALDFAIGESRWDGGYLCTKSYVRTKTKSCIRGSKNMLLLFSEFPELYQTAANKRLVDYFLDRNIYFTRADHTKKVTDSPATFFPFHYRFGLLEPLNALSRMGYGRHKSLESAWKELDNRRGSDGKYRLDWKVPKCSFNPGPKGQANKWVTLYAYKALKLRDQF